MGFSGRFVRVFQWIAPVLLPVLVIFGRGLLGAPVGWMMLFAIIVSPFVLIAMYFAPIIVVFDRDARAARSTRTPYNIASWVTWGALLIVMLTIVDGGDAPPFGSVLSTWGVLNADVSSGLFAFAICIAFAGWLGTLATAILGVVQSRGPARSTRPLSAP